MQTNGMDRDRNKCETSYTIVQIWIKELPNCWQTNTHVLTKASSHSNIQFPWYAFHYYPPTTVPDSKLLCSNIYYHQIQFCDFMYTFYNTKISKVRGLIAIWLLSAVHICSTHCVFTELLSAWSWLLTSIISWSKHQLMWQGKAD